ncbi:hypothetical protein MXD63_33840 [Frankia sp. Cpl3]|nr:hypothetical protein [Frankia sp. Cpl3]
MITEKWCRDAADGLAEPGPVPGAAHDSGGRLFHPSTIAANANAAAVKTAAADVATATGMAVVALMS